MAGNYAKLKISLFCVCLIFFAGCANTSIEGTPKNFGPSISSLKPEEYPREIAKYHAIVKSDPHPDTQQHAHLYLASLYSSPLNPNRNYMLARKHLETYAFLDPAFTKVVEPRSLLAAIIEIESLSTLAATQAKEMLELRQALKNLKKQATALKGDYEYIENENVRLEIRTEELQNRIRSLEASNNKLHKTIEMLSTLDSRLEEKRSNFIKKGSTEEQEEKKRN